jgi:hypothetical protein
MKDPERGLWGRVTVRSRQFPESTEFNRFEVSLNRRIARTRATKLGRALVAFVLLLALSGCFKMTQRIGSTFVPGKGPAQINVNFYPGIWLYTVTVDPAQATLGGTPPYFPFLMRQANCSLTRSVIDATAAVQEQDANYQDFLHNSLQVPTTADKFAGGCQTPGTGVASQAGAVVATLPNGSVAVAALSADGALVSVITSAGAVSSQTDYPTTSGTVFGLASADLNNDGITDLVVASAANSSTGTLSVLLGNGDGTFHAGQSLSIALPSVPNPPVGVTIDDVNGDGKLDLIAVTASDGSSAGINVFLGNGSGTFPTTAVSGPAGAGGAVAVIADFNSDGKKDIATSYGQILLGNGDGTFGLLPQTLPEGQQRGVAAADLNQDGKIDLAFTNSTAATVDVYFGNGDGSFVHSASYPTIHGATTIEASDLDGDGFPDLFVGTAHGGVYTASQFSESSFQSLLNYGDGTFGPSRAYFPGPPSQQFDLNPTAAYVQYATANFTSSGKPDLLLLTNGTSGAALAVLKGKGDGTFSQSAIPTQLSNPSAPQFISAIASGDMNGDGKPDMVFAWGSDSSGNNPHLSVAFGNGDGTFQPQQDYVLPASVLGNKLGTANGLVLADLRGTGKPDVALLTGGGSSTALYTMLNNGDGTLASAQLVDSRPWMNDLVAQDVSGDGKADIAVAQRCSSANSVTGSAWLYLGKGDGSFQPASQLNPGFACPNVVAIADMNGDGKRDLVFAGGDTDINASSGYVAVFLGNGTGTFQNAATTAVPAITGSIPTGIAVADVLGDGKLGVLLGEAGPFGDLFLLPGNGDGTFDTTDESSFFVGINSRALQISDLTGQGLPDLLLSSGGAEANGAPLSVQVFKAAKPRALAATTTMLQASASSLTAGQSVTFTATVAPQSGGGTPTGVVSFIDGTTTIGNGSLNSSGVATLLTSSLAPGAHSVIALYPGDTAFASSTSAAVSVQVTATASAATMTALASSANPSSTGQAVTFTATVTSSGGTPTGNVNFLDGSTQLGSAALNGSGQATFMTSSLAAGTHSITASYVGNSNFAASTSAVLMQAINAAGDFSVSASPSSQTVAPGQGTSYTLTLTPSGGFNQAVSVSCTGAPANSTCTPVSGSVTLNGTSASQIQINVATSAGSVAYRSTTPRAWRVAAAFALLPILFGMASERFRRRPVSRTHRRAFFVWLLLALAITGCSGGGSSKSVTGGTPAGTYMLTLTGTSGNTVHSASVTLVVQ